MHLMPNSIRTLRKLKEGCYKSSQKFTDSEVEKSQAEKNSKDTLSDKQKKQYEDELIENIYAVLLKQDKNKQFSLTSKQFEKDNQSIIRTPVDVKLRSTMSKISAIHLLEMNNNNSKSQTSPVKSAKTQQNSISNFQIEIVESKVEMNEKIYESEHS